MCMFPLPNNDITGLAFRKGIVEFDCGACPECLRKRANVWALRSVYESREHVYNCMVTLTYDDYVYDSRGNVVGERPPLDLHVNKRDVQLFIKRLRKWYSSFCGEKIKYLLCAEYGSRTHRAHYHALLFGVRFPDLVFYKRSKRGNLIYKSAKLTELWKNGICTVDSINVGSAVARYCTKYCAKSRSDDTFMLFSQCIGFDGLLRDFNGLSYFVEGREYPIPKQVWQYVIMSRHSDMFPDMSPRYFNRSDCSEEFFERSKRARDLYVAVRDTDELYVSYLDYWSQRSQSFDSLRKTPVQRIYELDEAKFHFYKVRALDVYSRRHFSFVPVPAPGSGCISTYGRWVFAHGQNTCPSVSCLDRASDTIDFLPFPPRYYVSRNSVFVGPVPRSRSLLLERKLKLRGWQIFSQKVIDMIPFM